MKYCKLKRKFWKMLGIIKTPVLETLKLLSRFLQENKIGIYPVASNPEKRVCKSLGTFLPYMACPLLLWSLVFMVISEVLRINRVGFMQLWQKPKCVVFSCLANS